LPGWMVLQCCVWLHYHEEVYSYVDQ
jgi:hypothetical protein